MSQSETNSPPENSIRKFMDRYAKTGDLRAAAKAAKISLEVHHQMLETSDSYRKSFRAAQQQVVDLLETAVFRRALDGSDELLVFLLRAWLPERYREHTMVEHSGTIVLSESEASSTRGTVARLIPIKKEQLQ
jgi:hypothetical protein